MPYMEPMGMIIYIYMAVSIHGGTPQILHEKRDGFSMKYPAMGYSIVILGDHLYTEPIYNFLTGYTCSLQFAMAHFVGILKAQLLA